MEQEADELAPVILYRAHVEPRMYVSYLQLLKKLEQTDLASVAGIVSVHPPINDRLAWVKTAITKLPPLKDPDASSAAFLQVKTLLRETAKKGGKQIPPKEKIE
jgi:predicted Zn-dependent protease